MHTYYPHRRQRRRKHPGIFPPRDYVKEMQVYKSDPLGPRYAPIPSTFETRVKNPSYIERYTIPEDLHHMEDKLENISDPNTLQEYYKKREKDKKIAELRFNLTPIPRLTPQNLQIMGRYGITKIEDIAKYFKIAVSKLSEELQSNPDLVKALLASNAHSKLELNQRLFRIATGEETSSKAGLEAMTFLLRTTYKQNEMDDYLKSKLKQSEDSLEIQKNRLYFEQLKTAAQLSQDWPEEKVKKFMEQATKLNKSIFQNRQMKKEITDVREFDSNELEEK